jgi:hypothetical protein
VRCKEHWPFPTKPLLKTTPMKLNHPLLRAALLVAALANASILTLRADHAPRAVTASIGLLLPRLRWAGGVLTTGAMAAAILSHMTWLGYSIQGDHGLLLGMALVTFTCGFTVMWTYRHHIPGYVPATMY